MDELKPGVGELKSAAEPLRQPSETVTRAEPVLPPSDFVEQRRFPRIRCFMAVQMRSANDNSLLVGKLSDVSMGGCAIESPTPVQTGFQVAICPLASNGALWVEGIVANTRIAGGAAEYRMGIRFLDSEVSSSPSSIKEFVSLVERTAEKQEKQSVPETYLNRLARGKA
jgi:hypothetical protein